MLTILAKEWMESGEARGLKLQETVDFSKISPEDDGMFTRVTGDGLLYAHRVPNQDLEKKVIDTADVTLTSSEVFLIELTSDFDITAEDGSFLFICKISNGTTARDDFVTLVLRDGAGTEIALKQFQIDKGDLGYPVALFGSFKQDWAAGTTFKVYGYSGQDSKVMGTLTPTALKVVEAQAAPVTKVIQVTFNLGNGISRGEIENAIGVSVSTLKDTQKYVIVDNANHTWFVVWLKSLDRFAITKLNLK